MTAETESCPRCGAHMQATHHPLCQARDGTPTELDDRAVRIALALVEGPPVGEKYEAPDFADELDEDPEAVAYRRHEQQQHAIQQQIVVSLLQLGDVHGPVAMMVRDAMGEAVNNESLELARTSLGILMRLRSESEIPL